MDFSLFTCYRPSGLLLGISELWQAEAIKLVSSKGDEQGVCSTSLIFLNCQLGNIIFGSLL